MVDYITKGDTIIFSPEFNKPLDSELLLTYKKIIFTNYKLNDKLFDAYENNNFLNLNITYSCSCFNQPLLNELDNLISLTHLTFGYNFNQPLYHSLDNLISLTHLSFGCNCNFNQPLHHSLDKLSSLTHLTFGLNFNQPLLNELDNLTSLTHLTFGLNFNQPLLNELDKLSSLTHIGLGNKFKQKHDLPFNIKSIKLYCNNQYYINYLSDNIEEIEFGNKFNLELNNLPSSIKKISFDKYNEYNKELNCLPNTVELLQLPTDYNLQIKNIPKGLKKIKCSEYYEFINDFIDLEVEIY
jgi:hypothetical protein